MTTDATLVLHTTVLVNTWNASLNTHLESLAAFDKEKLRDHVLAHPEVRVGKCMEDEFDNEQDVFALAGFSQEAIGHMKAGKVVRVDVHGDVLEVY